MSATQILNARRDDTPHLPSAWCSKEHLFLCCGHSCVWTGILMHVQVYGSLCPLTLQRNFMRVLH